MCVSHRHASFVISVSVAWVRKSLSDKEWQLARLSAWNTCYGMKEREMSFWIKLSKGTSPDVCIMIKRENA